MPRMHRTFAEALMLDGTVLGPERQIMADRIRWEAAARNNRWSLEDNAFTFNAFSTWATLNRTGAYKGDYADFIEEVETTNIFDPDESDDDEAGAEAEDPTRGGKTPEI